MTLKQGLDPRLSLNLRQARLVHPLPNILLDLMNSVPQSLRDRMAAQRLHIEVVCLGWKDQERDNGYIGQQLLHSVVKSGEGLDKDIRALVAELVPSGDEEVQRLVQVEVKVAVEVSAYEFVDFLKRG